MKLKLEQFIEKFEENNSRWKVYVVSNLENEDIQAKTLYIKINKETNIKKEKTINISFFYVVQSSRKDQLEFREKVLEFIEYLKNNFEERDCFLIEGYTIDYFPFELESQSVNIAEITGTYNFTTLIRKEKSMKMIKLKNNINLN
ncbi:MAG: hypothetical protein ACRC1R_05155 [Cetobacterium sp.]|uniref:hypothetical protein n=1 Tax=Cetobacterium sp. TaxID=2071632 RepID=UPI003F3DC9FD